MRLSDVIADFIQGALSAAGGEYELRRSDLAEQFGCVPSQINYVITTRFSPEQGYAVESRRGGGGYIRIRQVIHGRAALLMHAINAVGDSIDHTSLAAIAVNLRDYGALTGGEAALLIASTGDQALRGVPQEARNGLRASVLKHALAALTCPPEDG